MNPKKRLKMSLNGERVDRPPCICPGGMMNMVTAELMERVGIVAQLSRQKSKIFIMN